MADELDVDLTAWLPAYRGAGRLSMTGQLRGMADRISAACVAAGTPREPALVERVTDRALPLFYRSIRLDPQADDLLTRLRGLGLALALVSNASSYSEEVLSSFRLRERFDAVVLSYELGVLKPHPSIYLKAAAQLGVRTEACVFIGDGGDEELAGARQVGMHTILVDRGLPHCAAAREVAAGVVASLAEVAEEVRILSRGRSRA